MYERHAPLTRGMTESFVATVAYSAACLAGVPWAETR
jgi:hypothetical protein